MKKITTSFYTLFFVLFIEIIFAQDSYQRQDFLDITHYKFELTLQERTDLITAKTTISAVFKKATEIFFLDLIQESAGKGMKVSSVMVNAQNCFFEQKNDKLFITLPPDLSKNVSTSLDFTIVYGGIPKDGLIISKNKYGKRTFFGDNWHSRARHWLPTIDHPHDKATCEFLITAPTHYQVIGNGDLVEETDLGNGLRFTHWKITMPLPTKVMVIGAGEFAVQYMYEKDIVFESWVYPEDREKGFYDYAQAKEIVLFLETIFGEYPYTKLANVQSKTRYGGMENATNIFYDENTVTGQRAFESLLVHEIVHQWFGNTASEADWHHVWLSEGFATYFTNYYFEKQYGIEKFKMMMQKDREVIFNFSKNASSTAVIDTTIKDYNLLLTPNVYEKGGWVLHMLRYLLGEELFLKGVRQYYEKYKFDNALSKDLQEVFEQVSGQDLQWFFEQWLYQPYFPEYELLWEYDEQLRQINIDLLQTQANTFFAQPLEIGLVYENSENLSIEILKPTQKSQNFKIKSPKKPIKIIADPNIWLLGKVKIIVK